MTTPSYGTLCHRWCDNIFVMGASRQKKWTVSGAYSRGWKNHPHIAVMQMILPQKKLLNVSNGAKNMTIATTSAMSKQASVSCVRRDMHSRDIHNAKFAEKRRGENESNGKTKIVKCVKHDIGGYGIMGVVPTVEKL